MMTRMVQSILGSNLSFHEAIGKIIDTERALLGMMADGETVKTLTTKIPGVYAIALASQCRVVCQYRIQYDDFQTAMDIQFEKRDKDL